jgi:hypothetical protein
MFKGGIMNYIFILWGCSLHHNAKGLLYQDGRRLSIGTSEGKEYFLHAGEDANYLRQLSGCGAKVDGVRIGRHIMVKKWHITDAGDGSEPFIGTIVRQGMKFILQDINTGHKIEILNGDELSNYIGQPILITGIVVGPHQIRMMTYKLLTTD